MAIAYATTSRRRARLSPWLAERQFRAGSRVSKRLATRITFASAMRCDGSARRRTISRAASGSRRDDQLLPRLGQTVTKASRSKASPDLGADTHHLGERDSYLGPELAEPHSEDVPNLDRVERLADASHWVHHDEPERVNQSLIDFFAPVRPAQ